MADTTASRLIVEVQGKGIKSTSSSMGKLDQQIVETNKSSNELENSAKGMSKGLVGVAIAAAGVVAGIATMTASSLKNAAALEQNEIALTTMLKSASKAKSLLLEWQKFGASTPFETTEIIKAGKQMVAFGFQADTVTENLKMIGDVAAGIGVPLGELSEIYSKIMVSNQVYAEDLNQLAGRGVPIFKELEKVTGKNAAAIKKMASEGKLGFASIEKVFKNLTKQGGTFFGMMKAQSKSLGGLWSTFKSQLTEVSTEVGMKLAPAFKELLTHLTNSEVVLPAIKSLFMGIASVVNGFVRAVTWVLSAIENLGKALKAKERAKEIKSMDEALKTLYSRKTNFMKTREGAARYRAELNRLKGMLVDLRIEQAKYTLANIKTAKTSLNKDMLKLITGVNRAKTSIDLLAKGQNKLTKTFEINDMGVNKTIKTRNHANRVVLGFTHTMKQNEKVNASLTKQEKKANIELQKNLNLRAQLNKQAREKVPVATFGSGSGIENKKDKPEDKYKGAVEWLKKMAVAIDVVAKKNKGMVNALSTITGVVSSVTTQITSIFSGVSSLMDAMNKAQIAALDARMEKELRAAGVSEESTKQQAQKELDAAIAGGNALEIIEKEKALTKATIEEKYQKKRAQLEYEGALASWQMNVAMAAASAPLAILNAVAAGAKFGIPGMIAFGAAATVASGLQVAAIAAAKPQAPSAQFGGSFVVPPGNPGDSASVNVNSGEKVDVTPVSQSGGGKSDRMVLQIGDRDFEAYLTEKMNKIANSGKFNITRQNVVKFS